MPTLRNSVLYDVNDFQVTPLLTDVLTAPTYDTTAVDVPGIAQFALQPGIRSAELKGDAKVIARKGNTDRYQCSATYGRLALDALVVFLGGDVTDVTGPPASVDWNLSGTNTLPYWKGEVQILNAEVADVHVTMHKCQVTGGTLVDQSTDNFGQPKIDWECIPTISDEDLFVNITYYDAVTPL